MRLWAEPVVLAVIISEALVRTDAEIPRSNIAVKVAFDVMFGEP
jgi:hypothetical protein